MKKLGGIMKSRDSKIGFLNDSIKDDDKEEIKEIFNEVITPYENSYDKTKLDDQ